MIWQVLDLHNNELKVLPDDIGCLERLQVNWSVTWCGWRHGFGECVGWGGGVGMLFLCLHIRMPIFLCFYLFVCLGCLCSAVHLSCNNEQQKMPDIMIIIMALCVFFRF